MSSPIAGFTQESVNRRTLILDADPRFDIHDSDAQISIKNIAAASQLLTLSAQSSSIENYQFHRNFDTTNFVNTGVTFRLELPLKFTLPAPVTGVTEDNFVEKVFKDFSHLSLRSGGLLNIMQDYQVTINNMSINVPDVSKLLPIFNYYENEDINSWMEASQRDRYQNYEAYVGNDSFKKYKVTSATGTAEKVTVPVKVGANEENIFLGGYKDEYNSRTPLFSFVKMSGGDTACHVKITMEAYLPFSILSLPGSDLSIYGVNNLHVNIRLKNHFAAAHLFSLAQRQTGSAPYTYSFDFASIDLDTSSPVDTTRSKLLVPYYNAPEYIREEMIDQSTRNVKPYTFAYSSPRVSPVVEVSMTEGGTTTVNLPVDPLSTVPRAIYIYAMRKKDHTSSITVANTPNVYARIDNVRVNFNDQITEFPQDALGIYMVAKSNDLHMDRTSALYTSGFPLKLEVQKDLSSGSPIYTGLAKRTPVSISVTLRDLRQLVGVATSATYEIIVAYAYDCYIEHFNGSFDNKDSLLMDVSGFGDRKHHIDFYSKRLRRVNAIGGFWGTLWRGIKTAARGVGTWLKNNPNVLNSIGSAIDPSLKDVGNTVSSLIPAAGNFVNNLNGAGPIRTLGAGNVGSTTFRNKSSTPFKGM